MGYHSVNTDSVEDLDIFKVVGLKCSLFDCLETSSGVDLLLGNFRMEKVENALELLVVTCFIASKRVIKDIW